ncbi:MAG TPA: sodium/solute symporter [Steroidobacteraceae bacterium]
MSHSLGTGILGHWDWVVVLGYGTLLVIVGVSTSRRHPRPEDYFLASRATHWGPIGLAMLASNISSTALIGLAGAAYATGISVYDYEWSAAVILVLFCVFLLPFVLRSRVYTMPEFLERRYDARARLYLALLTVFLNISVDSAGALYSGSLVCRLLVHGVSLRWVAAALAGAAGLYTILGGLRAVIYTETLQTVVLVCGASVVAFAAFHQAGGWHHVMSTVNPAALSLIRPASDPAVPWPGLAFGIPVLGFYYWCTNQFIVQRVLSAQSIDHGRRGVLLAGLLKLPVLLLMVLPGTCAILLFPHLARPDLVYPTLIFALLPAGLIGLVVAGFVAATMASVASTLNSASTIVTMDIVKRFLPAASEASVVRIGRLCTAGFLLLSVMWASQLESFGSLWQYLQAVLAYAVPPVVALFGIGLFWRGANATGAFATIVIGSACGLALFLTNAVLHVTHLHFLYAAPLLLLIDAAILVAVSCWTRRDERARIEPLMFTAAAFREDSRRLRGVPLWRNYRVQAGVLLVLTACIVILFR